MTEPSFTRFSNIPSEIRCKIWRAALSRRTVQFQIETAVREGTPASQLEDNDSNDDEQREEMFIGPGTPRFGLPSVCFVNHESYTELAKLYRFPVNRRFLDDKASAEHVSSLCKRFRTPKFNPEMDIMEWVRIDDWIDQEAAVPLFVAATDSVRHVSIRDDVCDPVVLEILEISVFDTINPLETLTLSYQGVFSKRDVFRIMKAPRNPRYLQLDEEPDEVLKEHGACVLPYFQATLVEATAKHPVDVTRPDYQFVIDDSTTKEICTAARLDTPQQRADEYVAYRVVDPGDTDFFHLIGRQQPFYTLKLSFHAVPWEAFLAESPVGFCFPGGRPLDGVPMKGPGGGPVRLRLGFCSRTFGLPHQSDPWESRCFSDSDVDA